MRIYVSIDFRGVAELLEKELNIPQGNIKFEDTNRGSRMFGRAMSKGYKQGLYYWHSKYLPGHFKKTASHKYSYQKRKRPYLDIKRALARSGGRPIRGKDGKIIVGRDRLVFKGGLVDNVRGGFTERKARSKNLSRFKATANKGKLLMKVPTYISMRRRDLTKPDMAAEITSMLDQEKTNVGRVVVKKFYQEMKVELGKIQARRRRKRK